MLNEKLFTKLLASNYANGIMLQNVLAELSKEKEKPVLYREILAKVESQISNDISEIYKSEASYIQNIANKIQDSKYPKF